MRCVAFAVVGLLAAASHAQPPAAEKLGPAGQPVVIMLPPDDLTASFVESKYGMRIYFKSGQSEVQGRRLFLGDGTVAVMFQADNNGWDSPDGRVNRAEVRYKKDTVIRVHASRAEKWAARNGETYVRVPGISFEVIGVKD